MRMNPDLIREILLLTENNTNLYDHYEIELEAIPEGLEEYTFSEIEYHIELCYKFNFIEKECSFYAITLTDLTPEGHLFLADIRETRNWIKIKEIATNVGSFSLSSLKEIAVQVISQSIIKSLNL
ncbi:DUF2513 domain-containing protein [Cetobacterium sp.]|uniref:DUF2513 domain-containing protein n=1 Tax=Cetobacterium sp. TaxID=2071632 RepID=UPI003F3613ED